MDWNRARRISAGRTLSPGQAAALTFSLHLSPLWSGDKTINFMTEINIARATWIKSPKKTMMDSDNGDTVKPLYDGHLYKTDTFKCPDCPF